MRLFAIFFLVAGAHAVSYSSFAPRGPFSKIIKMLNNLQVELQGEYDNEKKIFDKWLCWAQKLQGQAQEIVSNTNDEIVELQSSTKSAAAEQARLQQEAAEHQIDAERAHNAITNAKTLREKENEKFIEEQSDLTECVSQTRDALDALAKVGANGAANAGIGELGYETTGFLQANSGIAAKLKSLNIKSKHLDADQQDALNSFLQGKTSNASIEQVAGMLRSIEDSCSDNLSAIQKAEKDRQQSYVEVFESNSKLLAASTESANTKTSRAAAKLQASVDAANSRQEAEERTRQAQLQLQTLERDIPARKATQEQRAHAIQDEIAAIQQATAALAEAREYVSLLEVSSKTRDEKKDAARAEGAAVLAKVSEKDSNVAMIALQLKNKNTTFDRVITLIKDMIQMVEKDQANAKSHFEYCEKSSSELAAQQDKLENQGKVLEATIEKEKATQEQLGEQLRDEQDQIRNNGIAAKDAAEQRKNENEEFNQSETDGTKTLDLLQRAIEVLQAYYSGVSGAGEATAGSVSTATGGFGFIQLHEATTSTFTIPPSDLTEGGGAHVQGRPSINGEEPIGSPNKQWGGSKKGRQVVTLLQSAINDQKAEMQAARDAEEEAVAEYTAVTSRLEESTNAAQTAITEINMQLSRSQQSMVKAEKDQVNHGKDSEINRAARLVNDKECTDLLQTYMQRSAVRKQEVEAMNAVMAVLRNYSEK